ncbi:Eukaryotic-type protein kinase [Carbonactinospora thermoautotrophica]|uniref:non-specific serine/threonine protein kinase n=2 Tax=Carbonactinospora thermoautotrophica TaxID=1469144 RepID=A0A132MVL9_9ACTN|nr:serine/threonine-protein kinase [Carbonactinospora thermoautotrophica]KWX01422.1 Eukaryotic-type protein kinase [Carbonactinospora thermoautotrophica]
MAERVINGRYELDTPIGRGGMGEVWVGYDRTLDRRVAVKLLRADVLAHRSRGRLSIERFLREAQATARLDHPGVPAVHDVGEYDAGFYLVMQLVEGYTLGDLVAEHGPLPVRWVAGIGAQICAVLTVAHAVPLVHRDLKPHNVMVCEDGTVKVLDFGVAALLDRPDLTKLTAPGETVGTPAYMAPEQALTGACEPRSDLYALGCVLHELLSGEPVFQGETSLAVLREHLESEPRPLRELRPDVPADLERLVLDLLAKQPEDRPADAAAVYARLLPYVPDPPLAGVEAPAAVQTAQTAPTRLYTDALALLPDRNPLVTTVSLGPAARGRAAPPPGRRAAVGETEVRQARQRAEELAMDGRYTQAADMLREILDAATRAFSATHPLVLRLRFDLANVLFAAGDYRRALPEYEDLAGELARRGAGEEHVLHCRFQAVACRAALGETAAALAGFRSLLPEMRALFGEHDDQVLELRYQICVLLASSGQVTRARDDLRALLADMRSYSPGNPLLEDARQLLAHLDQVSPES